MHGHFLSGTRKLNRHYQSANEKPEKSYTVTFTPYESDLWLSSIVRVLLRPNTENIVLHNFKCKKIRVEVSGFPDFFYTVYSMLRSYGVDANATLLSNTYFHYCGFQNVLGANLFYYEPLSDISIVEYYTGGFFPTDTRRTTPANYTGVSDRPLHLIMNAVHLSALEMQFIVPTDRGQASQYIDLGFTGKVVVTFYE